MKSEFTLFRLSTVSVGLFPVLCLSGNSMARAESVAPNVTVLHCAALVDTVSGKLLGKTSVVIEYETVALRDQINSGWITGPAIGTTGGHADPATDLAYDLQARPGEDTSGAFQAGCRHHPGDCTAPWVTPS